MFWAIERLACEQTVNGIIRYAQLCYDMLWLQKLIGLASLQALQAAVQKIHTYVATLEEKIEEKDKKKK